MNVDRSHEGDSSVQASLPVKGETESERLVGAILAGDREAEREFSRIMHACISLADAIQAATDTAQGRRSDYWETRPGDAREDSTGG